MFNIDQPQKYETDQITPVQFRAGCWVKRDDLWDEVGVARGGKARTAGIVCRYAVGSSYRGIAVGVSRNSSVPGMLSRVAKYYGLELHVHTSTGKLPQVFLEAAENGAKIQQHSPGYMSVIQSRLGTHVEQDRGLLRLGLGLWLPQCPLIEATAAQVANIPPDVRRIVMVVGSGWMFRGVLLGLSRLADPPQLIGVCVGTRPNIDLPVWAMLVDAGVPFLSGVVADFDGIPLDPTYEAKCRKFLQPGDLFWIVCHRGTE